MKKTKSKKLSIIYIVILSFIALFSLLVLVKSLANNNVSLKVFGKNEYISMKQYDINEITKINIKTLALDIRIVNSNDSKISINMNGDNKDEINTKLENGNLLIESINESKCIGFCSDDKYIEVNVPKDYFNKIVVETVSADLYVSNLPNLKINFVTTSGDIELQDSSDIEVVSVSGDIDINNVTNKINLETTSGDIDIKNIIISENSIIRTVSGDVEIEKIDNINIKPSTRSGSVEINNNYPNTNLILNIITRSGDIEVN